jgi:hypothetical protein
MQPPLVEAVWKHIRRLPSLRLTIVARKPQASIFAVRLQVCWERHPLIMQMNSMVTHLGSQPPDVWI